MFGKKIVEWAVALKNKDNSETLTVFSDELDEPLTANSKHPNYEKIKSSLDQINEMPDEDAQKKAVAALEGLIDIEIDVKRRFLKLTDRVSVANGIVYFDGDPVDDVLTNQIKRFLEEGHEDFEPLAFFMEKVASNPNEHSRKQLFTWLNRNRFSLAVNGDILAYKGVNRDWLSGYKGHAIVNGEELIDVQIPNKPGSLVEMPRSEVQHDPSRGCGVGLHGANFSYAHRSYGGGRSTNAGHTVELRINPRDVVSVPSSETEKFRCCRYRVVREVFEGNDEALVLDGKR